jgi:mono/diheme cytochrome c family protein
MLIKPKTSGIIVLLTSALAILSSSAYAADSSTIKKGEQIFNKSCVACHHSDLIRKLGIGPTLTNQEFLSIASDRFLKETIRKGRYGTGMPPFSQLGNKKINAIIAYLRSHATLPNRSKEVDAEKKTSGDVRQGKILFTDICSACHGVNGDGYAAGGTGPSIGRAGFLDTASDGFIRETVKHGRSDTHMLGFSGPTALANLSDRQIDDIITYMRTLAK